MSDRECNYCVVQRMKRQHGEHIKLRKTGDPLFPVDVTLDGKWVTSFMRLPEECAC